MICFDGGICCRKCTSDSWCGNLSNGVRAPGMWYKPGVCKGPSIGPWHLHFSIMRNWALYGCDWYPFRCTMHIRSWGRPSWVLFGALLVCVRWRHLWTGLVNAFWDLEFDWEMDCVLWLGLMGLSSSFFFDVGRLDILFLPG